MLMPVMSEKPSKKALEQQLENLRTRVAKIQSTRPSQIAQLPLWADDVRSQPNEVCRAALFTVRRAKKREAYTDEPIFVLGDGSITYTGVELRAENDELVWLQCLHYAKSYPLGTWIEFTPHQLCIDIGWEPGGPNYKLIRESLLRLKATALAIESKRIKDGLALSLIGDFRWKGDDKKPLTRYGVQVPAEISEWFGETNYTRVQWEAYRSLPPVARRMHDYASSHRQPYDLREETLYKMCGSDAASLSNFRKVLQRNCKELMATGFYEKASVSRDGLVSLVRKTSAGDKAT